MKDADFEAEEPKKKNRRKNKKGKNKAEPREEEAAEVEADGQDEGLTVTEKAKKVKKAMEEYNALDHEDMVSRPQPYKLYA